MWICPDCRSVYDEAIDACPREGAQLAEVQAHQTRSRYPLLGRVIDSRYHLIGGLGQGGLGTVYLAQHLHLGQLFAVKFLDIETISIGADDKQKARFREDFLNEARVASVIRHEAVVRVSDFGQYEALPYLVMEYVPGPNLLQLVGSRGRLGVPEALNIARRIAQALDAFHERRLVHRDLKPANVVLDPRANGQLTLVDLGLVKDLSGNSGRASTHPLALRGTPGYLAPEQVPAWVLSAAGVQDVAEKQLVDARVDLYALGVILYEMLAGVSPYPDGSNNQIIIWSCTRDPIPLSQVEPPVQLLPGLEELIYDTMNRDPERRPASAAAFLDRLEAVASGDVLDASWPAIEAASMSGTSPKRQLRSIEVAPHAAGSTDRASSSQRGTGPRALLVAPIPQARPTGPTSVPALAPSDPFGGLGSLDDEDDDDEEPTRIDTGPESLHALTPPPLKANPPTPAPKLRLALLAIPAALLGILVVFFLRDPATPSTITVTDAAPAPTRAIQTRPVSAAPASTAPVSAAPASAAPASAAPASTAPASVAPVSAPASVAPASVAKPKPKRPRRARPATLLARADGLLKQRNYAGALRAYRSYAARVGTVPVEVKDRIRFCEKQLR